MSQQHSLALFHESLQSKHSRLAYTYLVKVFREYHDIKSFDAILEISHKEIQKMVETYVIHIKKSINPNTVPTYMNPIKTFLEINDVDLNWRKIKRLYPNKIKRSGASAYQTKDVKRMLDVTAQIRNKAIIHFLASTGVRVGAIPELKIRHLRDMPNGCKMVLVYENSTEEYNTFLTPEASAALQLYLDERKSHGENLNEDSPVFRQRYLLGIVEAKAISTEAIQAVVKRSCYNASIRGQKVNGRYSEQLVHGFRKRFNTILKLNNKVNDNAIEKMMGHTNGLDGVYLQITTERLFEEFSKGIADLTISNESRNNLKIQKLESEKSELQKTRMSNQNLEQMVQQMVNEKLRKAGMLPEYTPLTDDEFEKENAGKVPQDLIEVRKLLDKDVF
jgi:integrase